MIYQEKEELTVRVKSFCCVIPVSPRALKSFWTAVWASYWHVLR